MMSSTPRRPRFILQPLLAAICLFGCNAKEAASTWQMSDLDLQQDDFSKQEYKPTPSVLPTDGKTSELGVPLYPGASVALEPERTIVKNGIKCELSIRITPDSASKVIDFYKRSMKNVNVEKGEGPFGVKNELITWVTGELENGNMAVCNLTTSPQAGRALITAMVVVPPKTK